MKDDDEENLLTPLSLALANAPPRAPPHGSIHRDFLLNKTHATTASVRAAAASASAIHDHRHHQHLNKFGHVDSEKEIQYKRRTSLFLERNHRASLNLNNSSTSSSVPSPLSSFNIINTLRNSSSSSSSSSIRAKATEARPKRSPPKKLPHPHIPSGMEFGDFVARSISTVLPVSWLHHFRESGNFRKVSDIAVTSSVPFLAISHPQAARNFLWLSSEHIMTTIHYGGEKGENDSNNIGSSSTSSSSMKVIHLFEPPSTSSKNNSNSRNTRGLLFFVHGGAWGSGLPWMYRLVAYPFIKANFSVAIVGYRTYPDADVQEQVNDLEEAALKLYQERPHLFKNTSKQSSESEWLGTFLSGHSSGAHIALLMIIERFVKELQKRSTSNKTTTSSLTTKEEKETIQFDYFMGLSGPYSIPDHFDYEASWGVEELSPMKPACGKSITKLKMKSPALLLHYALASYYEEHHPVQVSDSSSSSSPSFFDNIEEQIMHCSSKRTFSPSSSSSYGFVMPKQILLMHGMEDTTVPFTATAECARILRMCGLQGDNNKNNNNRVEELYLGKTGHQDVVLQIMVGGKARTKLMKWVLSRGKNDQSYNNVPLSRL